VFNHYMIPSKLGQTLCFGLEKKTRASEPRLDHVNIKSGLDKGPEERTVTNELESRRHMSTPIWEYYSTLLYNHS